MSREIDERIVAMYFDNKNFEKNAQQTLQTLDELKKSTNMEGVGKGFEAFEEAAKKLNLGKLNEEAKKLKTSFNGLGNVLKKSLNAAMSPLNSVRGMFNELNGYLTKVAGIDIAGKIVHGVESAFRNLTIAPVSAGWNQYENTMDSVQTIMNSTGESIDTVKDKLGEMTEYANQTIYSLNDMTSNLGKFTNNGVKLQDATNAMIGLANATADAGQGAAQASMAMYNVSQAIGVGKMERIDWKSLENANIATPRLKQTFIDAAVAAGTLEKAENGVNEQGEKLYKYMTKAKDGVEATEVSVENFRETLSKGWLTKDAMMSTFAIYSGQLSVEEIAALGFSEKEAERLYQIGQNAMEAATQVRTFSKMMDALRESVQSGWAASFEYIFGDMQEGTKLWTQINDRIDKILTKSTENRNNILMAWRGLMKDENGQIRRIENVYESRKTELQRKYNQGYINLHEYEARMAQIEATVGDRTLWTDYRQVAIDSFMDLFDVVQQIAGTIKGAFSDVFGTFDANSLKRITQGFRDLVDRTKEWLGASTDTNSRINKIKMAFTGLFSVMKVRLTIMKSLFQAVWSIVQPLVDPLLNVFAKFGGWLEDLGKAKTAGELIEVLKNKFSALWDKLSKLGWGGIFEKIGGWITGFWNTIRTGISDWLTDNGLGGVVEWFNGLGESIKSGYNAVAKVWNDLGITEFFQGVFEAFMGLFRTEEITDEAGNVITKDPPIVTFFRDLGGKVEGAYNSFVEWWNTSTIKSFFEKIWTDIMHFFKGDEDNQDPNEIPIVKFFNTLGEKIGTAFQSVSDWWNNGENEITKFFKDLWEAVVGLFRTQDSEGKEIKAPIVVFFEKIWKDINHAFNELKQWWETQSGIPEFFTKIWADITGLFKTQDDKGNAIKSPIATFFDKIWADINHAFNELKRWWTEKSGIPKFFEDMWKDIS